MGAVLGAGRGSGGPVARAHVMELGASWLPAGVRDGKQRSAYGGRRLRLGDGKRATASRFLLPAATDERVQRGRRFHITHAAHESGIRGERAAALPCACSARELQGRGSWAAR